MSKSSDARQRIKEQQAKQAAVQKRNSLFVRLGVIAVIIAVIVVVAVIIVGNSSRSIPTAGPAPTAATEAGGFKFVSGTELDAGSLTEVDTEAMDDPADVEPSAEAPVPTGGEATAAGEPVNVIVYADPNCPHCSTFDSSYGNALVDLVDSGDITLEYRTVGFLDRNSATNYSSRAANMLACVVDEDPSKFFDVTAAVYAAQPNGELSDDDLKALAQNFEVNVDECVDENRFRPFVAHTTKQAQLDQITGTPSVWANGQDWYSSGENDLFAFIEGTK